MLVSDGILIWEGLNPGRAPSMLVARYFIASTNCKFQVLEKITHFLNFFIKTNSTHFEQYIHLDSLINIFNILNATFVYFEQSI